MILFHAHLKGNTPSDKYLSSTWCKAYSVNFLLISGMKPRLWLCKSWKCVSLMLKTRLAIYEHRRLHSCPKKLSLFVIDDCFHGYGGLKADNVKFVGVRRKSLAYASDRICGNVRASFSWLESLTTITHFYTIP